MKQPLFPSTIGTQSRFAYFLTVKVVVRKFSKSDGQARSRCFDKAVLAQGGGGVIELLVACSLPPPPNLDRGGERGGGSCCTTVL